MNSDAIAAIFVPICLFGLPVAAFIVSRLLRHQERMEMLRRGIVPPPDMSRRAYREWRRAGGTWPPPGSQQAPFVQTPFVQAGPVWTPEDDPQRALMKGMRLAMIGFGLTLAFGVAFGGYRGNPVILGGLIPMFVGIAQILIAMMSGAQFPGVQGRTTFIPPPHPPPGPGAPPPPPPPATARSRPRRRRRGRSGRPSRSCPSRSSRPTCASRKRERDGSPERSVPFVCGLDFRSRVDRQRQLTIAMAQPAAVRVRTR